MTRWKNPEKAFRAGCKAAEWVGFHDLRRFRACRWDLLGHASVQTTQRYLRGIKFDRQAMAARNASAPIVEVGLTPALVTNELPSTMKRLLTS